MRLWIFRWNHGHFVALGMAAAAWLAPKAIKILENGRAQEATHTTFATLSSDKSSELYLKDARAFLFLRTDSGQNLKLRDSVLVGPNSEAILLLSDDFGGGKIRLAANTIITLSRAGRQNEIPRIDIKQGQIKILEAPQRPKVQEAVPQIANDAASDPAFESLTEVSALPGILITSGENAIVFDEKIKSAELVAMPQSNSLEIKMPLATPVASEVATKNEVSTQAEHTSKDLSQMAPTISPLLLEEIEEASIQNESLAQTVVKIQEAKLANTKPRVSRREPAIQTIIETVNVDAEPPTTQVKASVKTIKKVEPIALAQKETLATVDDKKATEEKFYPLEISAGLSQRSYPAASGKAQAKDFDFGFKGENKTLPNLNVAVIANIAIANFKKPSTGAPRPLSFSAEAKYQALPNKQFWLVGGYTYQTSTISGSTTNYENLYAPHFGIDSTFYLGASQAKILVAPRFTLITSGSYWLLTPLTYYWTPRWGVGLNYSFLKIKAAEKSDTVFQSYSSAIRWKF